MYGVLRLGEKEFTDLMNQTVFIKREHELRSTKQQLVNFPEKGSRTQADIASKWRQIKALRNLDVERL